MDTVRQCAVAFAICVLAASRAFSQAGVEDAFDQLVASHQAIAGENAESQRVELVAQWVESNEWRSLPLADKAWLHAQLLALDQVDPNAFSVRWTGRITAPAAKEYVFTQHHLDGAYGGTLKLWIDGQLVLDTTAAPQRLGYGPQLAPPVEGAFRSRPVELVAGEAVSFQVEYVYHDELPNFVDASHQWRFPLPLLLWEAAGVEQQIIPTSIFSPPTEFQTDQVVGLRAEYFNDPKLSDSVGAFAEPGVQAIWNKRPVLPRFKLLQEMILTTLRDQTVSPIVRDGETAGFVRETFGKVLPGLCAADRKAAVESMAAEASLLSHLDIATFSSWMPHVAIVPDAPQVELLKSWSEIYDVPPAKIAMPRGYGPGSYAAANYRYYREAGLWFNGPLWPLTERLIEESLEKEDGGCNLLVSYVVSFSCRYEQASAAMGRALQDRLSDGDLSADVRASWLIAQSYVKELFAGGLPQPLRGTEGLQEAMLIAEDPALRFWLLQEWAVHLASTGKAEQARSLISSHGDEFREPAQVETLNALQSQVNSIEQQFVEMERTLMHQQSARAATNRRAILQRRRDAAQAAEEDALTAHYEQLLSAE